MVESPDFQSGFRKDTAGSTPSTAPNFEGRRSVMVCTWRGKHPQTIEKVIFILS